MKVSGLKPNTILKVTGGESPIHYWLYTGYFEGDFPCGYCHKKRTRTHEFLHYTNLPDALHNIGRFDQNFHFGSECVKIFVAEFNKSDIVAK